MRGAPRARLPCVGATLPRRSMSFCLADFFKFTRISLVSGQSSMSSTDSWTSIKRTVMEPVLALAS